MGLSKRIVSHCKTATLLALLALLPACAAFNYEGADAPSAIAQNDIPVSNPKIALVLGSGGPRGYAHLGVLRVLEEAGIKPDLIVGSSVGSLIGAFYAAGYSAEEMDRISMSGGPLTIFDINPFADRGWIIGQKLQNYVNSNLGARQFEDLKVPLLVIATRRVDKAPVYFTTGNIGVAVRASSAMPGIISPVGIDGVEYEDGDESYPLPVSAALAAGAEFVIAIDVSARPGTTPDSASQALRTRDTQRRARIDHEAKLADVLLHPDLGYWASPRASYFEQSRQIGEAYARQMLPHIQATLKARFD